MEVDARVEAGLSAPRATGSQQRDTGHQRQGDEHARDYRCCAEARNVTRAASKQNRDSHDRVNADAEQDPPPRSLTEPVTGSDRQEKGACDHVRECRNDT